MSAITTKELVRSLTDKRDFNVLVGAFTDEIHRNDRRSRDGFFQEANDLGKRLFEGRA